MGSFCVVVDGSEPDGGDLAARHDEASKLLETFTSGLRGLGMGVQYAALLTPADSPGEEKVQEVVPRAADPTATVTEVPAVAELPVEPDNSLPFKCPACGATYASAGECINQHPAEPVLPTEDVLAGAEPADPAAEPATPAAPEPPAELDTPATPEPPAATPPPAGLAEVPPPTAEESAAGGDQSAPTFPMS